jgi:hypothetical protein
MIAFSCYRLRRRDRRKKIRKLHCVPAHLCYFAQRLKPVAREPRVSLGGMPVFARAASLPAVVAWQEY